MNLYVNRHDKTAPEKVKRWVVTYQKSGKLRTLVGPAQGRFTYATRGEARSAIALIRSNNSKERLDECYGGAHTLEERECECWAGHFDPCGIYFD